MVNKKKIVVVHPKNVEKLAEAHHIAKGTVYAMLAYKSYSGLAQLVRKQAVDLYGGVKTTKVVM